MGMEVLDKDSRMWGMLCHLSALVGYFIPFGHIIGPLVIWLVKRESMPFVDDQGKEALNFQISLTIYGLITGVLCLVLIGFILLPIVLIGGLVLVIIAGIKANNGEAYRYPFTIRLVK